MNAAPLANAAWLAASLPSHGRFVRALGRVRQTQEGVLARILAANTGTVYGKSRGFAAIRTAEAYEARVPLTTWDDLAPFVDRIKRGEAGVLTEEHVHLLEPTGGSTRAVKWIPFTASLHAELRRGIAPWIADLFLSRRSLLGGRAYWSITPAAVPEGTAPSAVPVGFEEDGAYLGGALQRLVAATLAVPPSLRQVHDPEVHRRRTLLHLLRARDLRLISAWHPSFLELLLDGLDRHWNGLLRDLASPARARELEAVGPRDVRAIWPHLGLVSVWGDGHAAGALAALRARLPGIEIQPKGLLATEGIVTLPFRGSMPLAIRSHFFEFLADCGAVRRAWELEEGQSYSVVVTTGGGLYRYRLHDRVTVAGFLRETPCLRFLGKEDRLSDRCGEKLAEGFVAAVLERVLCRRGIRAPFAMLAPEEAGYALFLETAAPVPADLGDEIDAALRENPAYAYCRRLQQLGPVDVHRVPAGAYGRYAARLRELGQRLGDVKPLALDPRSRWEEVL